MLPADLIPCKLFYPTQTENQESEILKKRAEEVANVWINELEDPKKTTSHHLSSTEGKWSWDEATEANKMAGLGKQATNDNAECPFAGMKEEYQKFGSQLNPLHESARFNGASFAKKLSLQGVH